MARNPSRYWANPAPAVSQTLMDRYPGEEDVRELNGHQWTRKALRWSGDHARAVGGRKTKAAANRANRWWQDCWTRRRRDALDGPGNRTTIAAGQEAKTAASGRSSGKRGEHDVGQTRSQVARGKQGNGFAGGGRVVHQAGSRTSNGGRQIVRGDGRAPGQEENGGDRRRTRGRRGQDWNVQQWSVGSGQNWNGRLGGISGVQGAGRSMARRRRHGKWQGREVVHAGGEVQWRGRSVWHTKRPTRPKKR